MTRDERQQLGLDKWARAGHKGTLEWVTGFGKTRAAIRAIKLLRRNDKTRKVIVVVPGIPLKLQWEAVLRENDLLDHTEVLVINTAIMRPRDCTLLVLDEIHRAAAKTFSFVFEKIKYKFILGLTATIRRLDSRHTLLAKYAPICDVVTALEARRNRWIAQLREYNLGVEMNEAEKAEYEGMKEQFQKYFDKFDNDFTVMKECSGPCIPRIYEVEGTNLVKFYAPSVVKRAREVGWVGNTAEQAYRIMKANEQVPASERRSVWGGDQFHPYHPEKLHIFAIQGMRLMGKMKQFGYKLVAKLDAAEELIKAFNTKTITFAQIVETADELARRIGDEATVYHASLESKVVDGVKISKAKLKKKALEDFAANRVRVVCTAKALDEGADFPDLELGIILSFTSAPIQRTQRNGRVGRLYIYEGGQEKQAIIIYIYAKGTKEYYWLLNAQGRDQSVKWVDSVEEILLAEGLLPDAEQADDWVKAQ